MDAGAAYQRRYRLCASGNIGRRQGTTSSWSTPARKFSWKTAQFWASRACSEADGRRHIRGVIGPDEYHENIDDSAYTNVMARWKIRRGIEIAALLRDRWPGRWAELSKQLNIGDAELRQWQEAADTLFIGFSPESGLFEQFAGFFDLEPIDLSRYAERTVPLDVIFGRERTQRTQVVKQADIVALLELLPEECDARARLANFQYYEQCCGHGSSLSRARTPWLLPDWARWISPPATSGKMATDLADIGDSSAGGVHIAALGGLWQAAVFGFGGLSLRADALGCIPHLPPGWRTAWFPCACWRGRFRIRIDQAADEISADLVTGEPMPVVLRGQRHASGGWHPSSRYRPSDLPGARDPG